MKPRNLQAILSDFGQKYSEILGIDLSEGKEEEIFKWFLVSILFGARITETSVIKTFKCFEKHGVLEPKKILAKEWEGLVKILDEGSYTRYDFKTADKLLQVTRNLIDKYDGSLIRIHMMASDARDLEEELKSLGKGISDTTVSIFLRELRNIWEKADPKPTRLVFLAAENLGIVKKGTTLEEALAQLKDFWRRNKVEDKSFVNFETALFRLGRDMHKKAK